MEGILDTRLLEIGLLAREAVTKDSLHDCLFVCFQYAVANAAALPKDIKKLPGQAGEETKYNIYWRWARPEGKTYDVGTIVGLRQLCSDAAEQLTDIDNLYQAHGDAERLIKHIKYRFTHPSSAENDACIPGTALPEEPTDAEYVRRWQEVIASTGAVRGALGMAHVGARTQ